jgi:hypothetical protein
MLGSSEGGNEDEPVARKHDQSAHETTEVQIVGNFLILLRSHSAKFAVWFCKITVSEHRQPNVFVAWLRTGEALYRCIIS